MPHRHRATTTETRPYSGCIAHPCTPGSHGGTCEIERCKCGAWRATNRNGAHQERGLWELPEPPRKRGRPRLEEERETIQVRVPSSERLRYETRAQGLGLLVSEWIRLLCRRDAGLWMPDGEPIEPE